MKISINNLYIIFKLIIIKNHKNHNKNAHMYKEIEKLFKLILSLFVGENISID